MSRPGIDRLIDLIGRAGERDQTQDHPGAVSYAETTRQMVIGVQEDVRSLRRRLDALIFMVISAFLAEAATRVFGG